MLENIIFDLGCVLVDFYPEQHILSLVGDAEEAKEYNRIIYESDEWKSVDLGERSFGEMLGALCLNHPDKADMIARILTTNNQMLDALPDNIRLTRELHQAGYKLFYLTNTSAHAFGYIERTYGYFNYFSGGVASYKVGLIKPNPSIYKLLLDTYALNGEECIFVDDNPANTQAGARFGIVPLTLSSPGALRTELMKFQQIAQRLNNGSGRV